MTRRTRRENGRRCRRRHATPGFSLIEVLMAIFILGIGVISIAALFPAGIAQQRQSVDDVIGPIVARNAMAVIRSHVRADDFAGRRMGAEIGQTAWAEALRYFGK